MTSLPDTGQRVDPITLTVIWNGLLSIADEMGGVLRRTAFSEAVREGEDFSTGLFDAQARLIAQGNFTPGHLGSMPYVVQAVLRYLPPETLQDGDAMAMNDAALGSGHFPDVFLVMPVFEGGTLLGYTVTTAHHVDVGGVYPGSEAVQGVHTAYMEGIRILPVKLIRGGAFDPELLRLVLGNVRLPDKMRGDLWAQRNACMIGANRIRRLHAEYGQAVVTGAIEQILAQSEARARELIRALPEGTYSFEDQLDDYGPGTGPVRVAVDVTLKDGEAVVDFSRSSDEVPAAINCYLNYTRAYTSFAMRIFAQLDVPNNAGVERVIRTQAREGCFFNARYPAPSGGRASIQVRIFEAINGAMAKAVPERAMAAFSHWSNPKLSGVDPGTGRPWLMYDLIMGGYGGRATGDGPEALCPVFNCGNVPVEVHETNNPVRIRRLELAPDTGGAGRHRGGCGIRKDIELLCDDVTVSLNSDRHVTRPYGLLGGEPGTIGRTVLLRGGSQKDLGSKESVRLGYGDVLSIRLAGAGGYGPPAERDPARLAGDLADGFVTREDAKRAYGRGSLPADDTNR